MTIMDAMTDDPDVPSTPPRPAEGGSRRLARSNDRRIAGVAAGIAEYFGVDPTIVRLGFALTLVFTLGTGLLAYLILWLVLPTADGGSVVEREDAEHSVAMVVLGLGAILLLTWTVVDVGVGPITGGVLLPILLIGTGVVLLRRREAADAGDAPAASPTGGSSTPAPSPLRAADGPGEIEWSYQPADALTGGEGAAPPATPTAPTTPRTPDGGRPPRPPGVITPVVLGLMLVTAGCALALHLSEAVDVQFTHVTAAWLFLIAGGLVVSAFRGRATGLIPLGIVVTLALLVASIVDPVLEDGTGNRFHDPVSLGDLRPEYRLGAGSLRVDLSGLDLAGETRSVVIELAVGELDVILPPEPALELTIENDIGVIDFRDRAEGLGAEDDSSGFGNDFRLVDDEGDGRLVVDIRNDIGDVEVTRVAR